MHKINWIDTVRGIAILLMMVGHTGIPAPVERYIYSFHMPLFFLLSGMLFVDGKYGFAEYVKRKARSLLVPYVVFTPIIYAAYRLSDDAGLFRAEWVNPSWITQGVGDYPLWFLIILFLTSILFFWIAKLPARLIAVVATVCIMVAQWLDWHSVVLPYDLAALPLSLSFVALGYLLRHWLLNARLAWWQMCLLAVISVAASALLPRLDVVRNETGISVLNIGNALVGTVVCFQVSRTRWMEGRYGALLRRCGRNAMIFIIFSVFFNEFLLKTAQHFHLAELLGVPNAMLTLVRYALMALLYWLLATAINRWAPQLLGKSVKKAR